MGDESFRKALRAELVELGVAPPASKQDLFVHMAEMLKRNRRIEQVPPFLEALEHRETQGSTYMGDGLAIPHGQSSTVREPSVAYLRLAQPMAYESNGEVGDVEHAFMLAVPEGAANDHLQALAFLARALVDPVVRAALDAAATPEEVVAAFDAPTDV
ncbi:MAG: PTS sugar transporter subunit IIA [Microbacterium sp.]